MYWDKEEQHPTNIYLFKDNNRNINDVFLVFLSLTLNMFHTFF